MSHPFNKLSYTVKEAAETTGLSEDTLQRRIKIGELAAIKVGRRVLILATELNAWLETQGSANG